MSRIFFSAFLLLVPQVIADAQITAQKPKAVKVKRGLTLSLSLLTPLDSAHARVGDDVRAQLVRPLLADAQPILPSGWIVHGTVTNVKRAGKNCHDGEIAWKVQLVSTPNGDPIRIQHVLSYPFDPNHTGDPEWVPLDTTLKKIGRASAYVGLTGMVVALSPVTIPMGIAAREPCRGEAGHDQALQPGKSYLYAVSKDTRLRPLP